MFQSIFDPENGFFRFTGRFLDVVVLSTLWLLCCLPVVTIGPATAALYYSCVKCLRRGERSPYVSFVESFKENLKVGAGATAVFLVLGGALYMGFLFVLAADNGEPVWGVFRIAYELFSLLVLAVASCAFALLSRFTYNVSGLLVTSIWVTLRHLPSLVLVAVLNAALALLTWMGWHLGLMLLTPAAGALLASFPLERVLRKYTPAGEAGDELDDEAKPWYLR